MTVPGPEEISKPEELDFLFGRYCLRADGTLLRDNTAVELPPKELQVLRLLLSSAGKIVSADQLRDTVWKGVHVSPDSLPRCVSSLRSRLDPEECIQTVYKRGYRFNMPVRSSARDPHGRDGHGVPFLERRIVRSGVSPRLAIFPFVTGDVVPAYLGFGVAEQVMLRLARSRHSGIEVMAGDSVFHLFRRGQAAVSAARELGADMVLTGTIHSLPQHFRLRAEMIRAGDGIQLWIEDFLVPRQELSYADARLAKRISARVEHTFARPVASITAMPNPASREASAQHFQREVRRSQAYSLFLQANAQWSTLERHHMQDGIRGLHQAIDLDEQLTPARLQLMHAYLAHSSFGYMRGDLAAELARRQAEAIQTQVHHSHCAHSALGWILFHHDRDSAAAASQFSRPANAGYHPANVIYQARFALGQGRFSDAVNSLQSALNVDPYSPALNGWLSWAFHIGGDPGAAEEQADRALTLFPDHPEVPFFAANIFAAADKGGEPNSQRVAQAAALATRLTRVSPTFDAAYAVLAYAQARQGQIIEARALLDRQYWLSRERFVMQSFHAPALVELGEVDAAIAVLVQADKDHCPWLFELLHDPRLAPLRGEDEFERLHQLTSTSASRGASVA